MLAAGHLASTTVDHWTNAYPLASLSRCISGLTQLWLVGAARALFGLLGPHSWGTASTLRHHRVAPPCLVMTADRDMTKCGTSPAAGCGQNRAHMAAIGRSGGQARGARAQARRAAEQAAKAQATVVQGSVNVDMASTPQTPSAEQLPSFDNVGSSTAQSRDGV